MYLPSHICSICGYKRARAFCTKCHKRVHAYCGKYRGKKLYCFNCEPVQQNNIESQLQPATQKAQKYKTDLDATKRKIIEQRDEKDSDQKIIMMYRNGDTGEHGYFLCAGKNIDEARKEYERRGHKYEPFLLTLNKEGLVKSREKLEL